MLESGNLIPRGSVLLGTEGHSLASELTSNVGLMGLGLIRCIRCQKPGFFLRRFLLR